MADYATGNKLKTRLTGMTVTHDTQLETAVTVASRFIDWHCVRVFSKSDVDETRTFEATTPRLIDVPYFGDIVSVTSIKTDPSGDGTFEDTWDAGDYQLRPVNAVAGPEARPFTEIAAIGSRSFPCATFTGRSDRVQVTGIFGWPVEPPASVKEACLIVGAKLFRLKDAPFGVAQIGEQGYARIRAECPEATMLLDPYRRYGVLVA